MDEGEDQNEQGYINDDDYMGAEGEGEDNENQMIDDNDSNSDRRFVVERDIGWIQWFCNFRKHEFFLEIDEDFLRKKSNLVGIDCKQYIPKMLDKNPSNFPEINEEELTDEQFDNELGPIKTVYGLIHKRFITTPTGLALMREKYLNEIFGHCPRILCDKQVLLPIGLSEELKFSKVKVYCPLCGEVYKPKVKGGFMDGAFFGTSYPQIFLMNYPDLNPRLKTYKHFIPKIYGFHVFGKLGSKYYTKDKKELEEKKKKLNIISDH